MNFLELAEARYSVRSFKSQPIEDEKLNAILEAGKAAPTAANRQPQRVYVLKSAQAMDKIRSACKIPPGRRDDRSPVNQPELRIYVRSSQTADKPRKRKNSFERRIFEGIFACCVSRTCSLRSLTPV